MDEKESQEQIWRSIYEILLRAEHHPTTVMICPLPSRSLNVLARYNLLTARENGEIAGPGIRKT